MQSPAQVREALVRQWVESAHDDLAWAEMGAASSELRGVAQIGFHAQPAVEKLLKGLLTAHGVQPEEQHLLGRLVERLRLLDRATAASLPALGLLTEYAVRYRYPPGAPGQAHSLRKQDVLRDLETARKACAILEAAIEHRLDALRKAGP